jgi:glyoxylase-like metal-dependent hydrolase (beta-lactamase superfamily II)
MAFLTEPTPPRGIALPVDPGIVRIVANNPGVMTYHGTNTYLIEGDDGFVVLDPGPDDLSHVADILTATRGNVSAILLSHTHKDHLGATATLKAATGAKVHAFHLSPEPAFVPDVPLRDGDTVAGMTAVHTPGHASDHLCFARPDGILFTADHIMAWSSSVVPPPDGNMAAYFESLRLVLARDDRRFLPGHGPPLDHPRKYVEALLDNRIKRENAIAAALESGPLGASDLVELLYSKPHPQLLRAAERNVTAHLLKLQTQGRVDQIGTLWRLADFR